MKTKKIVVSGAGNIVEAFGEVQKYAEFHDLSKKDALHLRLLTEETFGMLREMTGNYTAFFYVEGDGKDNYLNIDGKVDVDIWERDGLLAMAKDGRNILAGGIMGKIRALVEEAALGLTEANDSQLDYGYVLSSTPFDMEASQTQMWSLSAYKAGIENEKNTGKSTEAWDELEKSIVANLADDVQVGLLKGNIRMIIKYKSKG